MVVQIAIMGLGVVGGGTADLLTENHDLILSRTGVDIQIKYILDIRDLPDSPYADRIVHDISVIASDPEIAVVAETIGGVHPAYEFTRRLLESGKSVVSSNKQLVSEYGVELLSVAAEAGCVYLYEASTGGGIPILSPLRYDLAGNEISEISGILNGTTNYILTRMIAGGVDFADALAEAFVARSFSCGVKSTSLHASHVGAADVLALVCVVALCAAILILG
jgi:homoserine dehydrogenase